jgi:DNA polymerase III delta subunit
VPNLDIAALRTHIKAGRLDRVYLLHGEDVKLIAAMVDAMEATIDEADRPFAVDRVYARGSASEDGATPVDVAASCRSLPMLGDRRLVIVQRAEKFLKPKRTGKAAEEEDDEAEPTGESESVVLDLTPLEDYVAQPADFATLVFVASEIDRTRRFTKKLVEKAQVVECGGIRAEMGPGGAGDALAAATRSIQDAAQREGRTIDPRAVRMLAERAGGDISKLRGDLERVFLFTQGQATVTVADIDEVVTEHQTVQDAWGLTNAIGDGDAARALRELAIRLEQGDSPHGVIGQLRWWVSNRLAESAPDRVKAALDALLRTDLALKSSGGEDRVLVERLIVELTGRAVARRPAFGGYGRR